MSREQSILYPPCFDRQKTVGLHPYFSIIWLRVLLIYVTKDAKPMAIPADARELLGSWLCRRDDHVALSRRVSACMRCRTLWDEYRSTSGCGNRARNPDFSCFRRELCLDWTDLPQHRSGELYTSNATKLCTGCTGVPARSVSALTCPQLVADTRFFRAEPAGSRGVKQD